MGNGVRRINLAYKLTAIHTKIKTMDNKSIKINKDGLQLILDSSTQEIILSKEAIATLGKVSETSINKWIKDNKIIAKQTYRNRDYFDKDASYNALVKYNPELIEKCSEYADGSYGLYLYIWSLIKYERTLKLKRTDLSNKDFSNQKLRNIDFSSSILDNANFSNSDLVASNFNNTSSHITFKGSDLTFSNFGYCKLNDCDFGEVRAIGAFFYCGKFKNSNFNDSNLIKSNFAHSEIKDTTFERCDLYNADFNNAKLENISFKGSQIGNSKSKNNFCNTTIKDVDFEKTNLSQANFYGSHLENVNFKDADFEITWFTNATLVNVKFPFNAFCKAIFNDSTKFIDVVFEN